MYILNGTDPEGDPVRFGMTFEKGSREYFKADPKSGNVTLVQELDREVSALKDTHHFEVTCCKSVITAAHSENMLFL